MPGKKWMTPEQLAFLDSHIPEFLKCQAEGRLTSFYNVVSHQFFTRWSERGLRFPPKDGETSRTLTPPEQLELSVFIVHRKEACALLPASVNHV
jgi:hypothetical protein